MKFKTVLAKEPKHILCTLLDFVVSVCWLLVVKTNNLKNECN